MWGERCPDEHVEAFCEMRTQMARDVPSGEIDYLPHVVDETRLRTDEDRVAAGWISIVAAARRRVDRSDEHTSELQSLMRISYAVFCVKKKQQDASDQTKLHHQH